VIDLEAPRTFTITSAIRHWLARRRLRQVFADTQPTICVALSYASAVRVALGGIGAGTPTVWVCQEDVASLLSRRSPWRVRRVFEALRRTPLHIVCLRQTAVDAFTKLGFSAARLHLIPNAPVFPDTSHGYTPAERQRKRLEAGLPDAELVAICVAHLNPVKRHDILLEAVARATRQGVRVALACVGSELTEHREHAAHLRALTTRLNLDGQVVWAGEQTNVYDWLALADVAVLASDHEAAPTFLLEAAAAGLPLLGSDVPGIRDVITPGLNGELFPDGDSVACAKAMIDMAQDGDRWRSLGTEARRLVEASRGRMEQQWTELLRTLDVESR
jgi:glycosyltransferase involved in cell wall biosynthesis